MKNLNEFIETGLEELSRLPISLGVNWNNSAQTLTATLSAKVEDILTSYEDILGEMSPSSLLLFSSILPSVSEDGTVRWNTTLFGKKSEEE